MRKFILGLTPAVLLFASIPASAVNLLPYGLGTDTTTGEIRLFDPSLPAGAGNPVTAETGLTDDEVHSNTQSAILGTVSGNIVSNLRNARHVYMKGGRLWWIDLASTASHTPHQFTNTTDACEMHGSDPDLTRADFTWVRLRTAGPDGMCNTSDDTEKMARLGMAAGAKAKVIAKLQRCDAVYDTTARIISFVCVENKLLTHRDATLANPVTMLQLANNTASRQQFIGKYLHYRLRALGQSADQLFRYDMAGNPSTVSAALYTFTASSGDLSEGSSVADSANLYFVDGVKLMRTPLTATSTADTQRVTSTGAGLSFNRVLASPGGTHLVFDVSNGTFSNGSGVYSVLKTATNGTPTLLKLVDIPGGVFPQLMALAGEQTFITVLNFSTGATSALRITADGTTQTSTPKSYWSGAIIPTSFDLSQGTGPEGSPTSLLRTSRAAGVDTVKAIDPATGTITKSLGSVPSIITDGPAVFGFGLGHYVSLTAIIDRGGGNSDEDAYFADSNVANSLSTVIAHTGTDDMPVGGLGN